MATRGRILVLVAGLAAPAAGGCAGGGGTFGFGPPTNRLTPTADALRHAAAAPAPLPRELNKALLPSYVVEPGDTLLVTPADLDSPIRLPGDQVVMQDGTIDLGRFGRPVVAGKTVPVIEEEVNRLIGEQVKEKDRNGDRVAVRLVGRVSKVFYVLGEVNAPGAYPLSGRETVLDGILVAGGLTRQASHKKVILSRPTQPEGCRVVLPICYDNIVQLGDTSTNYQLMPGDRIYVAGTGMLDFLKDKKEDCPPCNGPQFPCNGGGDCGVSPVGPPTLTVSVSPPAPLPPPIPPAASGTATVPPPVAPATKVAPPVVTPVTTVRPPSSPAALSAPMPEMPPLVVPTLPR